MLSACPDRDCAERIATTLIEEQLAACVSLLPGATSFYRWQGALERSEEVLLLIKTEAACEAALTARLQALHPYELPELIAVEVASGLPGYLAWVAAQTASPTAAAQAAPTTDASP